MAISYGCLQAEELSDDQLRVQRLKEVLERFTKRDLDVDEVEWFIHITEQSGIELHVA